MTSSKTNVSTQAAAKQQRALASAKMKEHTDGKTIRKIIFVPGKLLNIVAN